MRERNFVARDDELAELVQVLADARGSTPGIVLVHGDPGVGKTALVLRSLELEPAVDTDRWAVLQASGDTEERDVAWAYVDQLARSIGHDAADELAAMAALADPSAVGAWLLGRLGELESERPVALVLDDLQWADSLSSTAVLFALRRLRHERIVVLATARRSSLDLLPPGVHQLLRGPFGTTLALEGMGGDDLERLARAAGHDVADRVLRRLEEETHGNPLHVLALLDDGAVVAAPADQPLPAPASYRSLVLGRLAACTPDTEQLVLAAAALGQRASVAAIQAVADVGDPTGAIEQAVREDLMVEVGGGPGAELAFAHPMVRAAVYHDLGAARRAELHRRAALHAPDEWSRLRHLAAASTGASPELADELVAFASTHRGTGPAGNAEAAAAFRLAAGCVAGTADRQDLMLRSLECLLAVGDAPAAHELASELPGMPVSSRTLYLQGSMDVISGAVERGVQRFEQAWTLADTSTDPSLRAGIASQLSLVALNSGRPDDVMLWSGRSLDAGGNALLSDPTVTLAMALAGQGRREEVQAAMPPVPDDGVDLFAIPRALATGVAALWDDDPLVAHEQLSLAYEASRAFGVFFVATLSLVYLSEAEFRLGRWDEAVLHGELAASTARDADQAWFLSLAHGNAALPLAARGRRAEAGEHVDAAMAAGFMPTYELWARYAAGFSAVADGDLEAASAVLEPLVHGAFGPAVEAVKPWRLLTAEVRLRRGDLDGAEGLLEAVDAQLAGRDLPIVGLGRARVGALLQQACGDEHGALETFGALGAQLATCPNPVEVALVQLDHGALLRRANRRRDAAAQLAAAEETFQRLGATSWAARAAQELASCGLTPSRRGDVAVAELTPAERTVALLVAGGARTKEVAAELVVSPKTVEYHLGNIYRKLGVSNRAQLATSFAAAGPS